MERFRRTYMYEFFHLRECSTQEATHERAAAWMDYYNQRRPHESLVCEPPSDYSQSGDTPPLAAIFARFLHSGHACSATLRALAAETNEKIVDTQCPLML